MPQTEVLFYQEENDGQVVVDEWLKGLPPKAQDKCQAYLQQLEDFGYELRRPVADFLRDGIYELRPSFQGIHYRMLYFFPQKGQGKARAEKQERPQIAVVSHGLIKKGPVPEIEIDRAIERKKRFEADPEGHTFTPSRKR